MGRCICLDTVLQICFNEFHQCICLEATTILSCKADIHKSDHGYQEWHNYLYFNQLLTECFCKRLDKLKFLWCNDSHNSHNCICIELITHAFGSESCRGGLSRQQHFCICSYISDKTYQKMSSNKHQTF